MRKLSMDEIKTYFKGSAKYGTLLFAITFVALVVAALFLNPDGEFVEE